MLSLSGAAALCLFGFRHGTFLLRSIFIWRIRRCGMRGPRVCEPLLSSRTAGMASFLPTIKGEGRHRQDPSLVSIEEVVVGASSVAYRASPLLVIREFAFFSGNLPLQSEAGAYLSESSKWDSGVPVPLGKGRALLEHTRSS